MGNYCSKKGKKMSRDTLLNPLPRNPRLMLFGDIVTTHPLPLQECQVLFELPHTAGVNFINFLQADFTQADPEGSKKV